MSFSTDMAKLVADQLSRFVTLRPHQLAGQAANLDFWLAQVRHALGGIDGYGESAPLIAPARRPLATRAPPVRSVGDRRTA